LADTLDLDTSPLHPIVLLVAWGRREQARAVLGYLGADRGGRGRRRRNVETRCR
jgi:hypothetical protein